METDEPKDDEDELAALMVASTTVRKRKLEVGSSAINTKRRKQLKDLAVLASSDNASQREREQNFAANYYNKLKAQLDEPLFDKTIKLLSNFDGTSEGVIDLFKEMSVILPPSLAEEFLCFLTPSQAHLCGKFMDHIILSKITDFFRKFEMSFAKQPQMVRKFYDILCQLATSENISLQQVREAVLPLLKSKSFLMEYFLQLFPAERPPDSIILDDFEEIYLDGDCVSEEEIRLADTDESSNCPCSCHPSHPTHCQRCSVKYINGRVYIQAGKILRSARVEFRGLNPTEAFRRVCVNSEELTPRTKQSRRKPDILNQKDLSPVKHVSSPHMAAIESEDESLEVKANNMSGNKPKSARSLKHKFKSSEKLSTKGKNSKIDEVSEEMRIISDENAITDTPDCFLARRLSPMETDSAVVGNLNFNNFLHENQNDPSRHPNIDNTLNFAVHSPLKKASICLDGFDSTSESIQSPIKLEQRLIVPLKRLEDEDLLMTQNSKGISSSESSDLASDIMNSSYESSKVEHLKQEPCMNSSISENMESIFTTSVVEEMNLLLGSSNVNKMDALIEPSHSGTNKNTHNGVEKYSEPTIDSMTIDSFLNISNLDAKIDAFLTNPEGTKNLDFLNDSSLETSNIDKSISETKERPENYLFNSKKDSTGLTNNASEEKPTVALAQPDKPVMKVVNNMDSLLNFSDEDVCETKITPTIDLVAFEESSSKNFDSIESSPSVKEEELEDKNVEQDLTKFKDDNNTSLLSPIKEEESEIKEEVKEEGNDEIKGTAPALECDKQEPVAQMICSSPKLEKEEINLNDISMISVFDTLEENKMDCRTAEPMDCFPECKVVTSSLVASQENVAVIDSVQSVSFICGEEGGESGKVTLFSAEAIEDKLPQDSNMNMISIPVEVTQAEFCNNQIMSSSLSASLEKIIASSELFPSPPENTEKSGKSMISDSFSSPPKNVFESEELTSSDSSSDPSKDIQVGEKSISYVFPSGSFENSPKREILTVSNSYSGVLKDTHLNVEFISSNISSDPLIDAEKSANSMSSDSSFGFLKDTEIKSEELIPSNFSASLSKDTKKIVSLKSSDSSTNLLKEIEKGEKLVSSNSSKNTQKSEKLMSSNSSSNPSKEVQISKEASPFDPLSCLSKDANKSEKMVSSDARSGSLKSISKSEKSRHSDSLSVPLKDTQKNGKLMSLDSSSGPLKITQKSEKLVNSNSVPATLKDTKKSEKLFSSDSSPGPLKGTQKSEKLSHSNSTSSPSKDILRNEKLSSKDTSKSENLADMDPASKDSQKSEKVVPSNTSSHLSKDAQKSEKVVSSEVQVSEQARQSDHSADSSADLGNKSKDQGNDWTMEEDKIILQTFQKDPDMQDIFSKIKTQLPERSLLEVQSRFYVLIELLEKMSHNSDDTNKGK